jgi:single-strand DNA-binding protein
MASINNVVLSGNLGADPEVKYSQSGTAIANVNIAVNEYRKDQASGESQQVTHWIRLVLFGRTAEVLGQYCGKGSKITISGRLSSRQYEDKDGNTRYVTEVIVRDLDLPPKAGNGDSSTPPPKQSNQRQQNPRQPNDHEPPMPDPDDNMPF